MITNADIVNELNNAFINIGKQMTYNLPNASNKTIYDYQGNKNDHSIFLEPSNEPCNEEIHYVVSQLTLKKSRDHHYMNMYCIKYIIGNITKA